MSSFLSFIFSGIFPILSLKSSISESQAIEKLQSFGTLMMSMLGRLKLLYTPKSLQMLTAAMKLKDAYSSEEKL